MNLSVIFLLFNLEVSLRLLLPLMILNYFEEHSRKLQFFLHPVESSFLFLEGEEIE
jgi:hypothetical protein